MNVILVRTNIVIINSNLCFRILFHKVFYCIKIISKRE